MDQTGSRGTQQEVDQASEMAEEFLYLLAQILDQLKPAVQSDGK